MRHSPRQRIKTTQPSQGTRRVRAVWTIFTAAIRHVKLKLLISPLVVPCTTRVATETCFISIPDRSHSKCNGLRNNGSNEKPGAACRILINLSIVIGCRPPSADPASSALNSDPADLLSLLGRVGAESLGSPSFCCRQVKMCRTTLPLPTRCLGYLRGANPSVLGRKIFRYT